MYVVYLFMLTITTVPLCSRLELQSSKREVVSSSPTVGKNFSFCHSRFLCVPHSLIKQLRMKSSLTYT